MTSHPGEVSWVSHGSGHHASGYPILSPLIGPRLRMSTLSTSTLTNQIIQILFLKKLWLERTPGCAFLCFLQEKTVHTVQCCVWWPGSKGVCLAFRPHKNCVVLKNRPSLLFPSCPLFLCVFCCFACFAKCKSSVTFFACCFLLTFGLCLFVRLGAFPAPIMLLC